MKKEFKDIIYLFERVLNILDNLEKRIELLEDKTTSKNYIYSNYIPIIIKDNGEYAELHIPHNGEYAERYEILYKTIDHNNCKFWINEKCTINVEPVMEEKDNKFNCLAKEIM